MGSTTDFAALAALMGDPARAAMLDALMDGRALTATELARCAGVAPQTASSHLAKLNGAGLITASEQGRYRYYRISSPAVAGTIEQLWTLSDELAAARQGCKRVVVGPEPATTISLAPSQFRSRMVSPSAGTSSCRWRGRR
jgi:DNA-binding transcriptional ArsR family regulator